MKILALDLGDRWTGVAISDPSETLARPFTTVKTNEIESFLQQTITSEELTSIVVGYPKTLRGTESEQTKKVIALADHLKKQFPTITWVFWDERLTSKQASGIKRIKDKEGKTQSHAIAAALILSSYLEYKRFQHNQE